MKALFLLVGILFSLTTYAEVKPEGAIVPIECGDNIIEGPNYPGRVCVNAVAGPLGPVMIITLDFGQGFVEYRVVMSQELNGNAEVVYQTRPALVEQQNGYMMYIEPARGPEMEFVRNLMSLRGSLVDVQLQPQHVTK